ncbi:amidohydrolase [Aeromonas salmonicida]|uniref:amidohydrolase n=1 Tax=Aeromonas salmonicida TaxID=645 RepID=UPI002796D56F|nr:amidohydrolase [Aeromonas salmonicida]MDQ1882985.1 amidohydrolase [Aeromonas salmonicida]
MNVKTLFLASLLVSLPMAANAQSQSQTLIFGGTIYSGDPANPHPEAVGIEGKKIVAVGSYQEVSARLGSHANQIDLKGKYLMPGLIDSHVHAAFAGFQAMTVNFPDAMSQVKQLQQFLTSSQDDPRLTLGDVQLYSNVSLDYWHQLPLLDQVFNGPQYQQIPVVLAGSDAHTGWANQAMLRKAGIDGEALASRYATLKGNFGLTPSGKLNGFASEGGWDAILKALPPVSDETIASAIMTAAKQLNQVGITAWMDPISNIRPLAPVFNAEPDRRDTGLLPAYSMLSREGKLTGHVSALALVGINASPAIIDDVLALQRQFQDAPDVKLVGIKILQDGVIEFPSQTAKLSEPYLNRPGYSGRDDLDKQRFNELIRTADAHQLIAHFHAIGDRAVRESLDAIAYARAHNQDHRLLHSITHLEVVSPASIARFKPLNVAASMQLLWAGKNVATTMLLEGKVPPALLARLYPAGSLLQSGAILAGASDWPVSSPNPFLAIYTAITRQGELGLLPPASEQISRQAILQAYTLNAAKVIGQEKQTGSISVGKSADLVLLDRNLEQVASEQIKDTKVLWTMFKGKRVYQAL